MVQTEHLPDALRPHLHVVLQRVVEQKARTYESIVADLTPDQSSLARLLMEKDLILGTEFDEDLEVTRYAPSPLLMQIMTIGV